jgi:hypothetical protein
MIFDTLKKFRDEMSGAPVEENTLMYAALDIEDAPALREVADALRLAKDRFYRELARNDVEQG